MQAPTTSLKTQIAGCKSVFCSRNPKYEMYSNGCNGAEIKLAWTQKWEMGGDDEVMVMAGKGLQQGRREWLDLE